MRRYLYPARGGAEMAMASGLAVAGMVIAGIFGILHDQITYTISPEYFTRMKFDQFRYADFGFAPRVFVAEIGFLATWWVGLIATWFLARIALAKFISPVRKVLKAVWTMLGVATAFAIAGYFIGPWLCENQEGWSEDLKSIGVTDNESFARVAGVHLFSYVGALVGWLAMMAWLVFKMPATPDS